MIDALLIANHDWANTGFRFSRSMRMMGINALMIKAEPHPFMYPEQAIVHPELKGEQSSLPHVKDLIESAKVVHFIASSSIELDPIPGKKYVVQHGGSVYRFHSAEINKYFNKFCDATIIQCPDLLGLGAKNETLIYYPVDTELIQPVFEPLSDRVLIGHFPSNPVVKGTERIIRIIKELEEDPTVRDKFEYIGLRDTGKLYHVTWWNNIRRMSECDILVETCNDELRDKPYGEWGNTALEGAALGKIVITNSIHKHHYDREYGDCALEIANTRKELKEALKKWICASHSEREEKRKQTREWAHAKHGMKATGERILNKVYRSLL